MDLKGLETKFSPSTTTSKVTIHQSFSTQVWRHLVLHGLDLLFYIKDENDKMINIVKNFALLTTEEAINSHALFSTIYDKYDKSNNRDSKEFLLNSIDE